MMIPFNQQLRVLTHFRSLMALKKLAKGITVLPGRQILTTKGKLEGRKCLDTRPLSTLVRITMSYD